jgi:hypothetical protein
LEQFDRFLSEASWPILGACFFGVIIIFFLIYILIYQRVIRARARQFLRWDSVSDKLIMKAMFFDGSESKDSLEKTLAILEKEKIGVPKQLRKLLRKEAFRSRLMNKIVTASRNVSGTASENLSRLFRQLQLDIDIMRMLDTGIWYKQATALELMGFMKLTTHKDIVFRYVDHQSGLVRMEAQDAVLRFYGFEGLHFLTHTKHHLSEWQQMKLLEELAQLPHEDFKGINEWFKSENDTAIIFALKLVRIYYRFELFQEVLATLEHPNPDVRFHAISVLKALPSPEAVPSLIKVYSAESPINQVEILKVLQEIASETEVEFLAGLLHDQEFDIILEAVRALYKAGPAGREMLKQYDGIEAYPLNKIIAQVKEEVR